MKRTNVCEITEELLCGIGYRFSDHDTLELFLAFVNSEFRAHVARELIESLTDDQKDALTSSCTSEAELMPRLLSMIQSSEDLPQVEMVVMQSWHSFCEDLKSQKEQIMSKFGQPYLYSHKNSKLITLNPIIPN